MKIINLGNIAINQYLIKILDGYMLIDTGYADGYSKFKNKLGKKSIELSEIKYVFITHAHDDHVGFLKKLLEEKPEIIVFLTKETYQRLAEGHNRFDGGTSSLYAHFICNFMRLLGKGNHNFPPITKLENYVYIDDAQFNFADYGIDAEPLLLSGHTNDNVGLIFETKFLFCGDAAMNGPASKNRNILYIENKEKYISSWEKMIKLDIEKIFPGHGKAFDKSDLIKNFKHLSKIKLRKLKK